MGTKVQSKTYFPGSMTDLNNNFCNGVWDLSHDDKIHKISGPGNSQHYDYFLTRQAMDGYTGYAKEQIRQTILKQESIFKHQLQELHRLYKRQRDLMNPVPAETSKLGHFPSKVPSDVSKEMHIFASSFPLVDSTFTRASTSGTNNIFSPLDSIKGKSTLEDFGPFISKCNVSERRVIDLELPADVDESMEGKQQVGNFHSLSTKRVFNFADLNEPIQVEETAFSASVSNKNSTECLAEELQKRDSSAKRTIFGVEICERNQTPPFDSLHTTTFHSSNPQLRVINSESSFVLPWRNTTSLGQNASTLHHNHWLGSSDSMRQIPGFFAGNSRLMTNSRSGVPYHGYINNSSVGLGFLNGIKSKDSVSDNLEELCAREKHKFTDMQKNHETPEQGLPPWLTAESCLQSEQIKGKETTVYHINLDSLQNHSQQFFKKAEMAEGNDTREFKKVKINDSQSIAKILGVPIIDLQNSKDLVTKDYSRDPKVESHRESMNSVEEHGRKNCISDIRHHIDLNLSLNEEDAPPAGPSFLESIVKIATMEIDLEAPAFLESDSDYPEMPLDDGSKDTHVELVKYAAEAIISISSSKLLTVHDTCQPSREPSAKTLMWFAEVITSPDDFKKSSVSVDKESIPEGMDYFEYMTLKLQDTEENYHTYKPMIMEEEKEEDTASVSKRTPRKGQGRRGRQRKDFQKDILPSIVSLSRREVTEDLQTFEEAFSATGVSWQSSLLKRKAAARNGRGRRRSVVPDPSCNPPSPPPQPPAVEQTICREVALEKSLGGWGRRTRRLPRQRCPNPGSHHSLALKC